MPNKFAHALWCKFSKRPRYFIPFVINLSCNCSYINFVLHIEIIVYTQRDVKPSVNINRFTYTEGLTSAEHALSMCILRSQRFYSTDHRRIKEKEREFLCVSNSLVIIIIKSARNQSNINKTDFKRSNPPSRPPTTEISTDEWVNRMEQENHSLRNLVSKTLFFFFLLLSRFVGIKVRTEIWMFLNGNCETQLI